MLEGLRDFFSLVGGTRVGHSTQEASSEISGARSLLRVRFRTPERLTVPSAPELPKRREPWKESTQQQEDSRGRPRGPGGLRRAGPAAWAAGAPMGSQALDPDTKSDPVSCGQLKVQGLGFVGASA